MATMNKRRRMDIWEKFDYVTAQACRYRDGVDELLKRDARHEYLDACAELRDQLAQISEMIEETIELKEVR